MHYYYKLWLIDVHKINIARLDIIYTFPPLSRTPVTMMHCPFITSLHHPRCESRFRLGPYVFRQDSSSWLCIVPRVVSVPSTANNLNISLHDDCVTFIPIFDILRYNLGDVILSPTFSCTFRYNNLMVYLFLLNNTNYLFRNCNLSCNYTLILVTNT